MIDEQVRDDVDDFIRVEASRPFAWGSTDCASTADRWVQRVTGISPMAIYGRKHRGEDDAQAWLLEPGSIAVAMNRVMRAAGFKRTTTPRPGDVGLVLFDRQTLSVGILGSTMWFAHGELGASALAADRFWKAWNIS